MAFRFYNGYDNINTVLPYDNPVNDIKVDNIVSYYKLEAKQGAFFEVPEFLRIGNVQTFTRFDETIMSKFGSMGVVQVDKDADLSIERWPTANNDADAKKRGDEIHESYLMVIVQDYVNRVEERKAQGLICMPAQGYLKHALKELGLADPAKTVQNHVEKQSESSIVAAMQAQIDELKNLVKKNAKPL